MSTRGTAAAASAWDNAVEVEHRDEGDEDDEASTLAGLLNIKQDNDSGGGGSPLSSSTYSPRGRRLGAVTEEDEDDGISVYSHASSLPQTPPPALSSRGSSRADAYRSRADAMKAQAQARRVLRSAVIFGDALLKERVVARLDAAATGAAGDGGSNSSRDNANAIEAAALPPADDRWRELQRTEVIMDSLNPNFARTVLVHGLTKQQRGNGLVRWLRVVVYNCDDEANPASLAKLGVAGEAMLRLGRWFPGLDVTKPSTTVAAAAATRSGSQASGRGSYSSFSVPLKRSGSSKKKSKKQKHLGFVRLLAEPIITTGAFPYNP